MNTAGGEGGWQCSIGARSKVITECQGWQWKGYTGGRQTLQRPKYPCDNPGYHFYSPPWPAWLMDPSAQALPRNLQALEGRSVLQQVADTPNKNQPQGNVPAPF